MSLFNSFTGDLRDDPILRVHTNMVNQMMNSFFSDPFGDMMGGPGMLGGAGMLGGTGMLGPMLPSIMGNPAAGLHRRPRGRAMMPFGADLFSAMPMGPTNRNQGLENMHSFSSSTMVRMTTGPDGRPQVYQASSSTRTAPGGVRETKKSVSDSRSGVKKMALGHHIGERAHIVEREQNTLSGEQEERQELINLDEDEADTFNREWESKTRRAVGGVSIEDVTDNPAYNRPRIERAREQYLALPEPPTSASSSGTTARTRNRTTTPAATATSSHERSRKRDHGCDGSPSRKAAKQHRRGRKE